MTAVLARFRIDLLLLAVAGAWGSTYLAAKELITPDSVTALLALRMLLAAVLMGAVVAVRGKRLKISELRVGVILGVLLTAIFAFETFGIAHTSATNAGLFIGLTIVFTPILDSVLSRRRLPGTFFLAATIAVLGVVLLAGNGGFRAPSVGDLLVLVAAVVRAVHVNSMHKLTTAEPMDPLHLTTVQLATCAVLFSVTSAFYGESPVRYVSHLAFGQVLLFLYLVVICTVFAFFVQTWAVRRTSPSRVSLLLGTEPVWAAVIGIAIAHDRLAVTGYCGVALVLGATAWGRSIEQRHRLRDRPGTNRGDLVRPAPTPLRSAGRGGGRASTALRR